MSATADKARYFLEQSVPELRELERKQIFTAEEISAVAKKRSDFEHKINARGSQPADYAQYAEFEMNVDLLRRKRVHRMGVKATLYSGQRRILFVFDRGNRKFPGDLNLWMQAIHYARGQKALKKVTQKLTDALRLHPTNPALWIYAAQFALEANGDMTEARGYMQRGLRFCKTSKEIWIQNFRLELSWIAKIHARRSILGIANDNTKQEQIKIAGTDDFVASSHALTQEILLDIEKRDEIDPGTVRALADTPVMAAAIPIAIFDAAMQQFPHDLDLAMKFFLEARDFASLLPPNKLLTHIEHSMKTQDPAAWQTSAINIMMVTVSVSPDDPSFPSALRNTFVLIKQSLAETKQQANLLESCRGYLKDLLELTSDPSLQTALKSKLQSLS